MRRKRYMWISGCFTVISLLTACGANDDGSNPLLANDTMGIASENKSNLSFSASGHSNYEEEGRKLRQKEEAYLYDDDTSGDNYTRYMLSFGSDKEFMSFQTKASRVEIEHYAASKGLENPYPESATATEGVPAKDTVFNDFTEEKRLSEGEGAPGDCVSKFKWQYRNNNRPHYLYKWGVWRLPVQYYINGDGFPSMAIREPNFFNISGSRDSQCQGDVGRTGYSNDEGGHLIANSLGGWGRRINITPQNVALNRRVFTSIESTVKSCMKDGHAVQYKVKALYSSSHNPRPHGYDVSVNVLHRDFKHGRLYGYLENSNYSEFDIRQIQRNSDLIRSWCRFR